MIAKYHMPLLFYLFLSPGDVAAQSPVEAPSAEMAAVGNWADVAFGQPLLIPSGGEARDGLTVLRQSHKVLVNRTAWDTPLTLADKQFAHGIYMDAPASLLVRLPQSAVELTAQVGIDNNPDTPGRSNHVLGAFPRDGGERAGIFQSRAETPRRRPGGPRAPQWRTPVRPGNRRRRRRSQPRSVRLGRRGRQG